MTTGRLVFLTGATGFIGGRLAVALAARGYRLRCLVRDPLRATALTELGAELVQGDVTSAHAVDRGLAGADVACHLAAIYDIGVVDEQALFRSNVEGTRVFLNALGRSQVKRGVYVSSIVALGPVASGVGDESTRWRGPFPTAYHRTKTEAHALALAAQQRGALIIVCPAYVYGPGDEGPAGRFLMDLVQRRVPALVTDPAWFSFVHVDDVVEGIIGAIERGRPRESYVLGGEAATLTDFATRAAAIAGGRAPRLRFPRPLALAAGTVFDVVSRATGRRFALSREGVASVTGGRWLHSHEKATREFGYRPRSLADGLPETMAWVRSRLEQG